MYSKNLFIYEIIKIKSFINLYIIYTYFTLNNEITKILISIIKKRKKKKKKIIQLIMKIIY